MTRTLQERSGPPGNAGNGQPEPAGFLSAYPGYQSTALLDRLRATEYSYLDAGGHVYLDYTGAGLPAQAQLSVHAERLRGRCFGNPHSENPTSAASTELIERARLAVMTHFNAPPEEYAVIFTPNATGACRLVGEAYPFGPRTRIDCSDTAQRRGDAGSVGPGRAAAGRRGNQAARPAGGRPAAQRPPRRRGLRGGPGAERARSHRSLA